MAKNTKSTKSKTVTVGCKLPNGLILELNGQTVEINGANSSRLVGGHGITYDVDAEFFDAWMEAHADRAMVRNGFIFSHDKAADTKAEAAEKEDNATGLEAVDPNAPNAGVTKADE